MKLVYFNARQGEPAEQALVKKYMQEHPNVTISYQSGIGGGDMNALHVERQAGDSEGSGDAR